MNLYDVILVHAVHVVPAQLLWRQVDGFEHSLAE